MRQFVAGLTLFGILLASTSAEAGITLTYEGIIANDGDFNPDPDHLGFVHNEELDLINVGSGPLFGLPPLGPAYSGIFVAINGSGGDGSISRQGGGLFDFLDLRIKGVFGDIEGLVQGYKSGGPITQVAYVASAGGWAHVVGNFSGIDELRITQNGGLFLIDDVRFEIASASVPEPASLVIWSLVLALGVVYYASGRRRRLLPARTAPGQP